MSRSCGHPLSCILPILISCILICHLDILYRFDSILILFCPVCVPLMHCNCILLSCMIVYRHVNSWLLPATYFDSDREPSSPPFLLPLHSYPNILHRSHRLHLTMIAFPFPQSPNTHLFISDALRLLSRFYPLSTLLPTFISSFIHFYVTLLPLRQ